MAVALARARLRLAAVRQNRNCSPRWPCQILWSC